MATNRLAIRLRRSLGVVVLVTAAGALCFATPAPESARASPSAREPTGTVPSELLAATARASPPPAPAPPLPAPPPISAGAGSPAGGVVNINTATRQELELLPGIGPAKAARILAERDRLHGFQRIRDLRRVKGIGRKTVERLRPLLTLSGPTTLARSR